MERKKIGRKETGLLFSVVVDTTLASTSWMDGRKEGEKGRRVMKGGRKKDSQAGRQEGETGRKVGKEDEEGREAMKEGEEGRKEGR